MKLELGIEDLRVKFRNQATLTVGFEHLKDLAQAAVRLVGAGTFYRNRGTDRENYTEVYPPK